MSVRLILVHGIAQDPAGGAALHAAWRELLLANASAPGLLAHTATSMAFYADILDAASRSKQVIAMGPDGQAEDPDELAFLSAGISQIARAMAIGPAELAAAQPGDQGRQAIAQSGVIGRALVGALAAIETRWPEAGLIALKVLKQVYVYLSRPATRQAIDQRLIDELDRAAAAGEQAIVIAHSLGTVIAFTVLRALAGAHHAVPQLVTLGSPLAIAAIKNRIHPPFCRPENVRAWANFFDCGDPVTLGRALSEDFFGPGIANDGTINNQTANAHGIEGYLGQPGIIAVLEAALAGTMK